MTANSTKQPQPPTGKGAPTKKDNDMLLKRALDGKQKKKSFIENTYTLMMFGSGIVFLLITLVFTFLFAIPKVDSIFTKKNDMLSLQEEKDRMKVKEGKIFAIDAETYDLHMQVVNRSIPTDLDLTELAVLINDMAEDHGLKVEKLSLDKSTRESARRLPINIEGYEISTIVGPFAFSGRQEQVASFLREWYKSEYALQFSEIRLNSAGDDKWILNLRILGYSMPKTEEVPPENALPTINQHLLEELIEQMQQGGDTTEGEE